MLDNGVGKSGTTFSFDGDKTFVSIATDSNGYGNNYGQCAGVVFHLATQGSLDLNSDGSVARASVYGPSLALAGVQTITHDGPNGAANTSFEGNIIQVAPQYSTDTISKVKEINADLSFLNGSLDGATSLGGINIEGGFNSRLIETKFGQNQMTDGSNGNSSFMLGTTDEVFVALGDGKNTSLRYTIGGHVDASQDGKQNVPNSVASSALYQKVTLQRGAVSANYTITDDEGDSKTSQNGGLAQYLSLDGNF